MSATDFTNADYPVTIKPLAVSIGSTIIGGIYLAAIGGVLLWLGITWLDGPYSAWSWALTIVSGLLIFYGIVVAIRGPGVAVILTEEDALVRGVFASRLIQRTDITGVSGYPSIQWTDLAGRPHKTPVTALSVNRARAIRRVRDHADEGTWMLRSWIAGQNVSPEQARIHTLESRGSRVPATVPASSVLASLSMVAGVSSVALLFPRYGREAPASFPFVFGVVAVVLAILASVVGRKHSGLVRVLAGIGAVLGVVGLIAAITFRGFSLDSFGQGAPGSSAADGTDEFLRVYPSDTIHTPSPSDGAPPLDTSTVATSERQVIDRQLVLIANRLIVPHKTTSLWPASVTVGADGTVVTSEGQSLGTVPAGQTLGYVTLRGRTDIVMSLVDSDGVGVAIDVDRDFVTAF